MPELEEALDALAAVAHELGLDAHMARREGAILSAAILGPVQATASTGWARATGMANSENLAAANLAFSEAAMAGNRWRGSATDLVTRLGPPSVGARRYAAALAEVLSAAGRLGGSNAQVSANVVRAVEAQGTGAANVPATPPRLPHEPHTGLVTHADPSTAASVKDMLSAVANTQRLYDPDLSPAQDPLVLDSIRLVEPLLRRAPGAPLDGERPDGEPDADPAAQHTDPAVAAAPAAAAPETPDEPVRSVEELLADLDAMIGLDGVKREVHQQVAMLKVVQKREAAGMRNPDVTRHLVFVGNPGTGKTTVARMVSGIYKAMNLLGKGHLVEVDRSELVAGYLGQTAIKTAEVCASAAGGVLFIDEAYSLGGDQYGTEAINTLVKEMEDRRDDLVVIVAGYPEPMVSFITQNPGLASRFKTTIEFADYTDDEIVEILEKLASAADYDVTTGARDVFREILEATSRSQVFGNGRFARNLLEEAIGRHAWRLQDVDDPTTGQLRELLAEDFRPAPDTEGDTPSGGAADAAGTTSDPEAFREDDPGSATDARASAATHGGGPA